MFKPGDKVLCINGNDSNVTKNHIYTVREFKEFVYLECDDTGHKTYPGCGLNETRFILASKSHLPEFL